MSSARFWIVVLALTSFLAGSVAGVLFAERLSPPAPERVPFADYARLLMETYDLPAEKLRPLHATLALYHRDLENLKSRHMSELEPELVSLGKTCRDRIRKYVLPEEQLTSFEQDAAGLLEVERTSSTPPAPGQN